MTLTLTFRLPLQVYVSSSKINLKIDLLTKIHNRDFISKQNLDTVTPFLAYHR